MYIIKPRHDTANEVRTAFTHNSPYLYQHNLVCYIGLLPNIRIFRIFIILSH